MSAIVPISFIDPIRNQLAIEEKSHKKLGDLSVRKAKKLVKRYLGGNAEALQAFEQQGLVYRKGYKIKLTYDGYEQLREDIHASNVARRLLQGAAVTGMVIGAVAWIPVTIVASAIAAVKREDNIDAYVVRDQAKVARDIDTWEAIAEAPIRLGMKAVHKIDRNY